MSKEDLQYSNQLRTHALRVMGTVEKCLSRIDDQKKIQEMLQDLGSKHVMYNAKVDYIDVSEILLCVLYPANFDLFLSNYFTSGIHNDHKLHVK